MNVGCGITSRHAIHDRKNLSENKIPMRAWVIQPARIFPIVVDVAKSSFPRSKVHEDFQKKRLHFWYLDSEQGDVLIILDIVGQDSTSTLNLYPPRYGVSQPLFIKDPIPLKHFFDKLDSRIQALGIPEVFMRKDTP